MRFTETHENGRERGHERGRGERSWGQHAGGDCGRGEHRFGPRGGGRDGGFGRHGHGHGWGGEDGEGRGGGRRRIFDSGQLRLVLLKLISDQPRHGYELIRAIEELTGGAYVPSPGIVYPTLTLLQEMGQIDETKSEGPRKDFAATAEGIAHLEANKQEVERLFARLADLAAQREKADAGPVRRAIENLRTVLRQKTAAGEIAKDTLHDIAAILDEAAQRIERL